MEDQRICIKFCVKNGFKGAEIFWMLQTAYGDAVMSRRRVFDASRRVGKRPPTTSVPGGPSTSTTPEKVDKVLELVREDRQITVREVAEEAGISFGSTQSIMKDILGVRRLNAVLVPKDLTFDQKNARKETASLNLEATTDDLESLKRVITGDETWIYGFDSETTQQASEWRFKNEPRPKKARKAPSKVKVMLTVFFDYQGIVHHEFQQPGSTITADSYLRALRRLRYAIRQKRPELWRSKLWILNHDNAPGHTALKISKFLQNHSTSVFPQPPYSPDLAPCDFFLFGKLKKKVKGSEISEHRRDHSGIEKGHESDPENRLPEVFCRLEKKVAEVHRGQRDYFEGDNLNLYWFRRFKSGDFDTRDKERGGRPIKFEDAELEALLDEDSSQTQEELAETLGVTQQAISNRLKVMGMVQKQGNWVPYELKPGNIEHRISTCELLLKRQNRKGFFASNRNEGRKVDSLRQPKAQRIPGHASTSTAKPNFHGKKLMLCIWWDQLGVIYYELLQPNETITGERYQQQLMRLSRA
ncbi:hypothetical protein LAZ67_11001294 [Cordylochernes scorpioides]|uniref:HTH cro/C1-type domain-containing protein n=1 Tax=Cordylochernes scorpioides TaxID=51811 RepID=A0ABY6KYD0_9ARAC|nr:hypothetical protein LAZ67_11001294 [Cordylochernes scorpioides]